MVCGTYIYSYWGESKPTYNWGGHIVPLMSIDIVISVLQDIPDIA